MKTTSLLGIVLELLDRFEEAAGLPADAQVGRLFRERRFLGARDRRAVGGLFYGWLRHAQRGEARWDAWASGAGLPRLGDLRAGERRLVHLAVLIALAHDGLLPWTAADLVSAARGLLPPAPLETSILDAASRPDALGPGAWPADPQDRLAAELSLPGWLARRLVDERGEEEARRLGALLLAEAPFDLRVNLSRVGRDEALEAVRREVADGPASATPLSPLGIRLPRRRNLGSLFSSHRGWFEVQDEGSQLVVLSADPGPDDVVIDACAGAGGKTVEILDRRNSRGGGGAIHACDIDPGRLDALRDRASALDCRGLSLHAIAAEGPLPPDLPTGAHLVLVDAPCCGTGTLRRRPELKVRFDEAAVARMAAVQSAILERFAGRVLPGGRLVYATCSLLAEENDAVVDRFLSGHLSFAEGSSAWAEANLPAAARPGARLRLDPLRTGTDGFFAAFLVRR